MTNWSKKQRHLARCFYRVVVAVVSALAIWWGAGLLARTFAWTELTISVNASSTNASSGRELHVDYPPSASPLRSLSCKASVIDPAASIPPDLVPMDCVVLLSTQLTDTSGRAVSVKTAKATIYEFARPEPAASPEMFEFKFAYRSVIWKSGLEAIYLESMLILIGAFLMAWHGGFHRRLNQVRWTSRAAFQAAGILMLPPLVMATYLVLKSVHFQHLLVPASIGGYLVVLAIRPLAEELFYRVWLVDWLDPVMGRWLSVLSSSALFTFAHDVSSISYGLALFLCGASFAYLWARFRSLWVCVTSHALVNAVIMFLQ